MGKVYEVHAVGGFTATNLRTGKKSVAIQFEDGHGEWHPAMFENPLHLAELLHETLTRVAEIGGPYATVVLAIVQKHPALREYREACNS